MKRVQISENKWNILKCDGTYLLNENAKYCYRSKNKLCLVKYNNNVYNFVNSEGKTLLKTNVEVSSKFDNKFAFVLINDICFYIDNESNFYNKDKVSFKELYNKYPNKRNELIEIIDKYTYYDVNEYFI